MSVMRGDRASRRQTWIVLGVVAFLPRLLFVLLGERLGWIGPTNPDSLQYQALARDLLAGLGWAPHAANATEALFRPPLYPCFLAGIFAVFGASVAAVRVVQAALGAASAIVVSEIADRAYGRRAAWIAGFLFAMNPLLLMQNAELMSESLFIPLYLATFLCFLEARRGSMRWACVGGVALGLAILCRPTPITAAPLLALGILWRGKGEMRGRLRRAAVFIGLAILVVAPWTVRGAVKTGFWVPVATTGEFTLYLGNAPGWAERAFEQGEIPSGQDWDIAEYRKIREAPPGWFGREARREIVADPARFLRISAIRCRLFFKLLPELHGGLARFGLAAVGYTILFPLGVAGLIWALRKRDGFTEVITAVIALMCLVHVISVPSVRYRFALVDSIVTVFAGGMLASLWLRVRRRSGA
jgi:4-amino-4-deoxy-L-arabinose transferase-like glycosyltransferase